MALRIKSRRFGQGINGGTSVTITGAWTGEDASGGAEVPASGDLIVLLIAARASTLPSLTLPSGFTQEPWYSGGGAGSTVRSTIATKIATGNESADYVITSPTTFNSFQVRALCIDGQHATWKRASTGGGVFDAVAGTISTQPITGTLAGDLVLRVVSANSTNTPHTVVWQSGDVSNVGPVLVYTTQTGSVIRHAPTGDTPAHIAEVRKTSDNTVDLSGGSSASIAIASAATAPPANTAAPALTTDGTPQTGETISCTTGSWTGSPTSYAYQWKRDGTNIAGATGSTYLLAVADEGHAITCTVTATNAGGNASASSGSITPPVTPPMAGSDIHDLYSGGAANTSPAASIGGARGAAYPGTLGALFGPILGTVAQAGGTFYRLVYVENDHPLQTLAGAVAFIASQFPSGSGLHLAVGVPTEGKNTTVAAIASETTAPSGVSFSSPADVASGLALGSLAPGEYRGLWLRLTVDAGSSQSAEVDATYTINGTPS